MESSEIIMWLTMRGAMSAVVTKVHQTLLPALDDGDRHRHLREPRRAFLSSMTPEVAAAEGPSPRTS